MDIYDAAREAAQRAENAIERADEYSHGNRRETACAVARTYLEVALDDDQNVDEVLGITLSRLERGAVVEVR